MSATESGTPASGFKYAIATFAIVALTQMAAMFLAVHLFGIAAFVEIQAGTAGAGLLAVVAGGVTLAKCRSWEAWRKWVWLPTSIAVAVAFVYVGLVAQPILHEQTEAKQECQDLSTKIDFWAAQYEAQVKSFNDVHGYPPEYQAWPPGKQPSEFWPGWKIADTHDKLVSEYNATC